MVFFLSLNSDQITAAGLKLSLVRIFQTFDFDFSLSYVPYLNLKCQQKIKKNALKNFKTKLNLNHNIQSPVCILDISIHMLNSLFSFEAVHQ